MTMSYDRIGNYRIREDGKKICIFQKVEEIKRDLKDIIPEVESDKLIAILSKVRTYYRNNKKGVPLGRRGKNGYRDFTSNERIMYDYMLRNGLNPCTTYRWFLATRLPCDIKQQLKKGKIGQKLAMKIAANRRRTKESVSGLLMVEEIRNIVQKLDWRG
jgi:hypothetical protein